MSDAIATRMCRVIVYSVLKRLRLPVTVAAALAVAEAAVFLLRPRDGLEPVDVARANLLQPGRFVERAEHFRTGQLRLYGAQPGRSSSACSCTSCGAPPRRPVRPRPIAGGAAVAAGLAVAVTVATLPVAALSRQRAKDVGLVTQDWVGWAGDVVKGTAIGAVFAAAGRRDPRVRAAALRARAGGCPARAVVVAFGVITIYASPVVIDPLFNKFTPLEGPLRAEVLDARRARPT